MEWIIGIILGGMENVHKNIIKQTFLFDINLGARELSHNQPFFKKAYGNWATKIVYIYNR